MMLMPRKLHLSFAALCCLSFTNALSSPAVVDVQYLERKVEALFRDAKKMPVAISRKKNKKKNEEKIEVKTTFDGDCMVTVAEATEVEHHPDDFRDFLENFGDAFPKVNPMARNVVPLEGNPLRQAVKSVLNFPFPLTNRIMVHWKYLRLNRSPHEHMLIISEEGNQDILRKHLTPQERDQYVLARTFLCVYWIRPIHCPQTGRVRGSSVRYAFSGDTGGTIPAWVQNQVGPKTALDSVQGLMEYVNSNKTKQSACRAAP